MFFRFVISSFLLYAGFVYAKYQCEVVYQKDVPIYVSDIMDEKGYKEDDFFKLAYDSKKLPSRKPIAYIPKKSIVQIEPWRLWNTKLDDNAAIKVEVLKANDKILEEDIKRLERAMLKEKNDIFTRLAYATSPKWWKSYRKKFKRLESVKNGEKIWIKKGSLKQVDDYTFYVNVDSIVHYFPHLEDLKGVHALKLKQNAKKEYAVNKCCVDKAPPFMDCKSTPLFEILYGDKRIDFNNKETANACIDKAIEEISVLSNESFQNLNDFVTMINRSPRFKKFSVADLKLLDWRGLVQFPVNGTNKGPYGSYHYKSDDQHNTDLYIKPYAACSFARVLEHQARRCFGAGCQIQFGDMYHRKDWKWKVYNAKTKKFRYVAHHDHEGGECVDIRPLRADDDRDEGFPRGIFYWKNRRKRYYKRYSHEKTAVLVDSLIKAGADPILFNDTKIPGVKYGGGHNDHIHACFRKENPIVQKACEKFAKEDLVKRAQESLKKLPHPDAWSRLGGHRGSRPVRRKPGSSAKKK